MLGAHRTNEDGLASLCTAHNATECSLQLPHVVCFCFVLPGGDCGRKTDGIGKAMAFQMAKKGMKVLLISRTESKLVDTEAEIKKAHPSVTVEHLAIDYSDFNNALQASLPAVMAHVYVCVTKFRVMLPN